MGFTVRGFDEFSLSLQEAANLPESTKDAMLSAGAAVVVSACRRKISELGLIRTGQLLNSIKAFPKRRRGDNELIYLVYPVGSRRRQGNDKAATNSEVGFIHEYGLPRKHIPAKQWMRSAVESSADTVAAAEAAVYDEYLRSINL